MHSILYEIKEEFQEKKMSDNSATKKSIELSKKEIGIIIGYIIISIAFIVLINNFFFGKRKESPVVEGDEYTIIYPAQEENTQVFSIPYDKTTGISIYMVPDANPDSSIVIDMLSQFGIQVNQWVIKSEDIVDGICNLSLEGMELTEGENYYLRAWSDNESAIGIYAGSNMDYGYGSVGMNGLNWVYSIEYDAFSSSILSLEMILVMMGLLAFLFYKKGMSSVGVLSILYASIALVFFLVTPVNSLFDEEGHFLRSFEISEGHFVSGRYENGEGKTEIPSELYYGVTNVTKTLSLDYGANFLYTRQRDLMDHSFGTDYISVPNPNQALYSPASYIPQSIGLFIGRFFTNNVFLYYFFGRFFAFLVNTMLVILAIRMIPEKKLLIFALAVNPIFLSQMVSYSADGTLNALSLFYIAYIIRLRSKEQIKPVNMIIIFIGSIIIALSKVIYFPFVLLVFMLSDSQFKSKLMAKLCRMGTVCVSFVAGFVWFIIAKSYLFDSADLDVMPDLQFKYVLTHFYLMPQVAFNTIVRCIYGWTCQLFGGVLGQGWLGYEDIIWIGIGAIVIIELFTTRNKEEKDNLKKLDKIIIGISILLIIGLTFASLYVQWTAYQADTVKGIQGRYFIPLILPAGLIIKRKFVEGKESHRTMVEILCILFIAMMAAVNTVQVYM